MFNRVLGFIGLVFVALLTGCTVSYTQSVISDSLASVGLGDGHTLIRNNNWRVSQNDSIVLGRLDISQSQREEAPRAMARLEETLPKEFSNYFAGIKMLTAERTTRQELQWARNAKAALYIKPEFVRLSNRLNTRTEISYGDIAYPDRKRGTDKTYLKFKIYDVRTGNLLDVAMVKSEKRLYANDQEIASDLFVPAIQYYLNTIVGLDLASVD